MNPKGFVTVNSFYTFICTFLSADSAGALLGRSGDSRERVTAVGPFVKSGKRCALLGPGSVNC